MSLSNEELLHGATITSLLQEIEKLQKDIYYKINFNGTKAAYQIIFSSPTTKNSLKIGLFLKHSRKRISPWRFTFRKKNQEEIETLVKENDYLFVLLITDQEGVAVIDYQLLKLLLDDHFDDSESISVSRKLRENYRINGSNGKLNKALPKNTFPKAIADVVNEHMEQNISKRKILLKYFKYLLDSD
ncbi:MULTISPECIES: hypothetical protein [Prochlorococcus]|uniref:Uncharacterized protein n=1 Tax=Prochlorococcus marinus (strain SARG / CCMP1375 / SS120) TaxID=167539 RepID=Q7VB27_PROMA|nr:MULTISPECIES: hypothetical protein [Prochlorococcus]AAQ00317.1 Predicted protein [Prochlorococcus marinus subsp. marinus str. CCMP1375]KGG10173.1 hypothetical protein EV04_1997 [Prochlorococcus marinus str. LG]KGG22234.1 hypothetical protein EV08_0410 [Prochlorococcus marinus str. SS2]KGG24449.1 hypothetical protein EV09_0079 [Prochlorococcus marinus str. SS35]KGG33344.1 hypothetical protein EV10_0551 [Prochlorococcus marinus str. SS51]